MLCSFWQWLFPRRFPISEEKEKFIGDQRTKKLRVISMYAALTEINFKCGTHRNIVQQITRPAMNKKNNQKFRIY